MATKLTSLIVAFARAMGKGAGTRSRRPPLTLNIGLDFGTAFTKCVIRDVANNVAYPLFVSVAGQSTFLIPSEVRIGRGSVSCPLDATHDGQPVSYLKMALAGLADARDHKAWIRHVEASLPPDATTPTHIEALSVWFLARVLKAARSFIIEKWPDFTPDRDFCFVNMAVPVAHAERPELEARFLGALRKAYALAFGASIPAGSVEALAEKLAAMRVPAELAERCYLYPEVSANVQSYIKSPAAKDGLYIFADVGAGTVDLSVFIYWPHESNEKPLSYLAAQVLPLGSSQIELRAAEGTKHTVAQLRAAKETAHERSVAWELRDRLDSARASLELEIVQQSETVLRRSRELLRRTQFREMQILLGGGGLCQRPYVDGLKCALRNAGIIHPPTLPLPQPGDREFIWPRGLDRETAFRRLSVAYGLSFLHATLDPHRYPTEMKPLPPEDDYDDRRYRAPTKDEM